MYVIQTKDATDILRQYSIETTLIGFDLLQYYHVDNKVGMVLLVESEDHKKFIIKLLSKNLISFNHEEQQAEFSEFLRNNDIWIPQKYMNGNFYGTIFDLSNQKFYVTVEDYFGEDVKFITLQSSYALGVLLAKMHMVSMKYGYHLKYGPTYRALEEKRVEMQNLWGNVDESILKEIHHLHIDSVHRRRILRLKELWDFLPIGAVHGDLGLTSNLMLYKKRFGVIDFNLSGDEVFLNDLLVTWYSSRYSLDAVMSLSLRDCLSLRKKFFGAYFKNRQLSRCERRCFKEMAHIINGIYFNRFVANVLQKGFVNDPKTLISMINDNYFQSDANIELRDFLLDQMNYK